MVYGFRPDPETPATIPLKPGMSLLTRVSFVKKVARGHLHRLRPHLGRSRATRSSPRSPRATPTASTGSSRTAAASSIGGRSYPVVGRVCMDQSMVDLGPETDVKVGDEVVLMGRSGELEIPCEEWAEKLGTITYEVTCQVNPRVVAGLRPVLSRSVQAAAGAGADGNRSARVIPEKVTAGLVGKSGLSRSFTYGCRTPDTPDPDGACRKHRGRGRPPPQDGGARPVPVPALGTRGRRRDAGRAPRADALRRTGSRCRGLSSSGSSTSAPPVPPEPRRPARGPPRRRGRRRRGAEGSRPRTPTSASSSASRLSQATPACRRLIRAHYLEGKTLKETAETLSYASSHVVWTLLDRCIRRLRAALGAAR